MALKVIDVRVSDVVVYVRVSFKFVSLGNFSSLLSLFPFFGFYLIRTYCFIHFVNFLALKKRALIFLHNLGKIHWFVLNFRRTYSFPHFILFEVPIIFLVTFEGLRNYFVYSVPIFANQLVSVLHVMQIISCLIISLIFELGFLLQVIFDSSN